MRSEALRNKSALRLNTSGMRYGLSNDIVVIGSGDINDYSDVGGCGVEALAVTDELWGKRALVSISVVRIVYRQSREL